MHLGPRQTCIMEIFAKIGKGWCSLFTRPENIRKSMVGKIDGFLMFSEGIKREHQSLTIFKRSSIIDV